MIMLNPPKVRIPKDYPVKPIRPGSKAAHRAKDLAVCGQCGRAWDDGKITSMTPTPAARCPFEAFHAEAWDD